MLALVLFSTTSMWAQDRDGAVATRPDTHTVAAWIDDARYDEALDLVERALTDPAPMPDCERADWLRLRGRALRHAQSAQCPAALESAEAAVQLARSGCGAGSVLTAALFDLGVLRLGRNDVEQARIDLESALAEYGSLSDAGEAPAAEVLVYLGHAALTADGDRARALELYERAARIQDRVLDPQHPQVAFRLTREANLAHHMGDDMRAVELGTRALAAFRARLPRGHPRIGLALHNLGSYYMELRKLPDTARCLEEALALWVERCPAHTRNVANTRMLLADVRAEQGDAEAAQALRLAAISVLEVELGDEDPRLCKPLLGVAEVALSRGDCDTARPLIARVIAILEQSPKAHASRLAQAYELLGHCTRLAGDLDMTRAHWQHSLEILRAADLEDDILWSSLEIALGGLVVPGETAEAALERLALLEHAQAARSRALSADHPDLAWTLDALAHGLKDAGRTDEAFERALEAAGIVQRHLKVTAQRLEERDALGYVAERTPGLGLALVLAYDAPQHRAARAWEALLQSRALVFDEMRMRRDIARRSTDPELHELADALSHARESCALLAQARSRSHGTEAPDVVAEREVRMAAELEVRAQAERALLDRCAALRELSARTDAGLPEIARAQLPGAALVAYARVAQHDRYVAFVLPAGSCAPHAIDLGPASEIDQLAAAVRAESRSAGTTESWRRVAEPLRVRVWDPVEPFLVGATELLIVPDGSLLALDFSALPLEPGRYVIDSAPPIHLLNSERDVLRACTAEPAPSSEELASRDRSGTVLAVGGPDYDWAASSGTADSGAVTEATRDGRRFTDLPCSSDEARAVFALWEASREGEPSPHLLIGLHATERAFRESAPHHRILHVATHGFASEDGTAAGTRGLAGLETRPREFAPMPLGLSRSHLGHAGLAFAGANTLSHGDTLDDGVLTDEEVLEMDLEGVDLAVLSACDSGVGEVQSGEGVFGLRRAFQLAGVRTVVTSLWPIDDRAARERMTTFHARLRTGQQTSSCSPARALRDAARAALEHRRAAGLDTHPWHWAGFVVAGEPARSR